MPVGLKVFHVTYHLAVLDLKMYLLRLDGFAGALITALALAQLIRFFSELDSYIFFPLVLFDSSDSAFSIVFSCSSSNAISAIALKLQMDLTIFDAHMEIALIFH